MQKSKTSAFLFWVTNSGSNVEDGSGVWGWESLIWSLQQFTQLWFGLFTHTPAYLSQQIVLCSRVGIVRLNFDSLHSHPTPRVSNIFIFTFLTLNKIVIELDCPHMDS